MTIKAVFFDAAGTLMRTRARVGETYARIAAKHGKTVSPADLADRFRVCFAAAPKLAFPGVAEESICALERDWWKDLVSEIFQPWTPFENFEDYFIELFEHFASYEAWVLYPEALDTLLELKRRGLILDVISNFDSRLIGILAGLGVRPLFDQVFLSSRVALNAPSRRGSDVIELAGNKVGRKRDGLVSQYARWRGSVSRAHRHAAPGRRRWIHPGNDSAARRIGLPGRRAGPLPPRRPRLQRRSHHAALTTQRPTNRE
jgi:putative hydrolase of the HAD superfamily